MKAKGGGQPVAPKSQSGRESKTQGGKAHSTKSGSTNHGRVKW